MEYDFLKIEEHSSLAECQINALSEVNNNLIEIENCLQQILKIKNIQIENTTRTKLLSLLDYLNKIIITPTSTRSFSYQYFFYYREVIMRMNEITLHFEFPALTSEVIPSLQSIFDKISKMINQTTQKLFPKKKKKIFNNQHPLTQIQNTENADDQSLDNTFAKLIILKGSPFEFAKAQSTFHELEDIIKAKFKEVNKDPSVFLIDYSIILQSVDACIDEINLSNHTIQIFHETISLISNLKSLENVNGDLNDEDANNENISNNPEDQIDDAEETEKSPFTKHAPSDSLDFAKGVINSNNLAIARSPQHTPERAKSLHTNLISIIEEDDKKIQQLQQNLSNEVQKKEEAQAETEKLKHHYRKKIKKLKEQIDELVENNKKNSQQKQEYDELKEKCLKLEKDNLDLTEQNSNLNNTIKELTEINNTFAQELEENEKFKNEELSKIDYHQNSEEIEKLNETISLQELEIQELDKTNKKYKDTINSLMEDNEKMKQENDDLKSYHSQFEKKEQILGKQISLLSAQNTKATNEIQKILKNQEKKLFKFSEMINSQIITNPDESIKNQLTELTQIKKIMSERNINSIQDFDDILGEYDKIKNQNQ